MSNTYFLAEPPAWMEKLYAELVTFATRFVEADPLPLFQRVMEGEREVRCNPDLAVSAFTLASLEGECSELGRSFLLLISEALHFAFTFGDIDEEEAFRLGREIALSLLSQPTSPALDELPPQRRPLIQFGPIYRFIGALLSALDEAWHPALLLRTNYYLEYLLRVDNGNLVAIVDAIDSFDQDPDIREYIDHILHVGTLAEAAPLGDDGDAAQPSEHLPRFSDIFSPQEVATLALNGDQMEAILPESPVQFLDFLHARLYFEPETPRPRLSWTLYLGPLDTGLFMTLSIAASQAAFEDLYLAQPETPFPVYRELMLDHDVSIDEQLDEWENLSVGLSESRTLHLYLGLFPQRMMTRDDVDALQTWIDDFLQNHPRIEHFHVILGLPAMVLKSRELMHGFQRLSDMVLMCLLPVSSDDERTKDFGEILLEPQRQDFRQRDLSRMILQEAYLQGAQLERANLSDTTLNLAILTDAQASQVNLSRSQLLYADMEGGNFSESNLEQAYLDYAQLSGAKFIASNLTRASLFRTQGKGADFTEANLSECFAVEADLHEGQFEAADLAGANFIGARLTGANFTGARLSGALFAAADLTDVVFEDAEVVETVFVDAIGIDPELQRELQGRGARFQDPEDLETVH